MSESADSTPPTLEPWFVDMLSPEYRAPLLSEVLRRYATGRYRAQFDLDAILPASNMLAEWNIDFNAATAADTVWQSLRPMQAEAAGLLLVQHALATTHGMRKLAEEWVINRKKGVEAPPDRMALLPRESGTYCTSMTGATDDEKAAMLAYDAKIYEVMLRPNCVPAACGRALVLLYLVGLSGIVGQFGRRMYELVMLQSDNNTRRWLLRMPTHHAFETKQIENMTLASSAADEREPAAVD